ncbi:MAG: nicotinate-nucleotide adenylyltransferase [Planctomycetota bacterium]|nr:nicotinate-nucleotide adenylyltransferase [Planctomycetota bacterium]
MNDSPSRQLRIGIFGGTFDPVHLGHLVLAESCRETCELDEIWFVPAACSPHKTAANVTSGTARRDMLEFATAGAACFHVKTVELQRGGTSYTVDTLEQIRGGRPDAELFFLIGADSLADLPTWREPTRIVELATVVAVNRGDQPDPDVSAVERQLGPTANQRLRMVRMPAIDISAHEIRERIASGRSIRYLVPRAVEAYIHEHQLYRGRLEAI